MMDEVVGHMTEKVVIPPADQIEVDAAPLHHAPARRIPGLRARREDLVPDMPRVGEGYNFHVTGLTHDERGYPDMTPAVQDRLVSRLQDKILKNADKIMLFEEDSTIDGADVRGGLLRHHLARRAARHRDGPRARASRSASSA